MYRSPPILFVTMLLSLGCNRQTAATYNQAVANAKASNPSVIAFQKLFPQANHFISHYTGEAGTPRWNSEALIHGRFTLTMQFDLTIDPSGTRVTAKSPPIYYLQEISSVQKLTNGQSVISYNPQSQREFGPREWKVLESAGGDLSVLGIKVNADQ